MTSNSGRKAKYGELGSGGSTIENPLLVTKGNTYLLVAGPGGSGKSTFINALLGETDLKAPVRSTLLPAGAKSVIEEYVMPADVIEGLPPHRRVVLVEVPGFRMGMTLADDASIMNDVRDWLKERGVKATGIVYLNETNPAKYRGTIDAKNNIPELKKWFRRVLRSRRTSDTEPETAQTKLNVVVGIVDFRKEHEHALREHWDPIVGDAVTIAGGGIASRLVLGVNEGCRETAKRMICHLLAMPISESTSSGMGSRPNSTSESGGRHNLHTPEPTKSWIRTYFGCC